MKIGLICPSITGHLNPLTSLGVELQQRDHEVVVLGGSKAHSFAAAAGLDFHCLGENDPLQSQLESEWQQLAYCSGVGSMLQTGKILGLEAKLTMKHLRAATSNLGCDGLVIDQVSPAAAIIADQVHLPYVIASNALAMYWDPLMPPPPLPWGFRDDTIGRIRNRVAWSFISQLYYWLSNRRSTQVDPMKLVFEHQHGLAKIAQQPEFFDFPRESVVPNFHYTGPWHRPHRDDESIDFPWDWLDQRPLLYASMGTLQNGLAPVFQSIIEAVRSFPMQVVLSKGGGEVELNMEVPDNVLVVDRAPQLRLLEKASFAITHAGLNTVLECLVNGVPMLCLPVTNDQPGVAKRVERLQVGVVRPVSKVSVRGIRRDLAHLLSKPVFTQNAQKYQGKLALTDGLSQAASIVEQAFTSSMSLVIN